MRRNAVTDVAYPLGSGNNPATISALLNGAVATGGLFDKILNEIRVDMGGSRGTSHDALAYNVAPVASVRLPAGLSLLWGGLGLMGLTRRSRKARYNKLDVAS